MGKPEPINYELDQWEITYNNAKGELVSERRFKVKILWKLSAPTQRTSTREVLGTREDKSFETFEVAKSWLDEQVGDEL